MRLKDKVALGIESQGGEMGLSCFLVLLNRFRHGRKGKKGRDRVKTSIASRGELNLRCFLVLGLWFRLSKEGKRGRDSVKTSTAARGDWGLSCFFEPQSRNRHSLVLIKVRKPLFGEAKVVRVA